MDFATQTAGLEMSSVMLLLRELVSELVEDLEDEGIINFVDLKAIADVSGCRGLFGVLHKVLDQDVAVESGGDQNALRDLFNCICRNKKGETLVEGCG